MKAMPDNPFKLDDYVAKYPDYPKPSILFYDISPALEDADCLSALFKALLKHATPMAPDIIAGIDARGFLFASPLALSLNIGAVMIRKAGKLPGELYSADYTLEYGTATLTLQKDRNFTGKRVLLVDDLIATGGTLVSACTLVEQAGGVVVGALSAIELVGLGAREKLKCPVVSLQQYDV